MQTSAGILLAALWLAYPAAVLSQTAPRATPPEEEKSIKPVDINRATAEEFATLPGIGPDLARRIVAYREKHGPFRRVEDLMAIRGIGRKKWKAIRPFLKMGGSEGEQ